MLNAENTALRSPESKLCSSLDSLSTSFVNHTSLLLELKKFEGKWVSEVHNIRKNDASETITYIREVKRKNNVNIAVEMANKHNLSFFPFINWNS